LLQFTVPFNGVTNFATRLSYTQYMQQDATTNSENKLLLTTAPSASCGWLTITWTPLYFVVAHVHRSSAAGPEEITHIKL